MKTLILSLALLTSGSAVASTASSAALTPVSAVGDYIHVGTGRALVQSRLGTPTASLSDGTWLYRGFNAPGASGGDSTLVVRFEGHKVAALALTNEWGAESLRLAARKSAPADARQVATNTP